MLSHYLFSTVMTSRENLHAYLMVDDKRKVEVAMKVFCAQAQRENRRWLPILLQTELSSDVRSIAIEDVRAIVRALSPEIRQKIDSATNFHFSIFTLITHCEQDRRLMRWH
jgi:hypothetical protein